MHVVDTTGVHSGPEPLFSEPKVKTETPRRDRIINQGKQEMKSRRRTTIRDFNLRRFQMSLSVHTVVGQLRLHAMLTFQIILFTLS